MIYFDSEINYTNSGLLAAMLIFTHDMTGHCHRMHAREKKNCHGRAVTLDIAYNLHVARIDNETIGAGIDVTITISIDDLSLGLNVVYFL